MIKVDPKEEKLIVELDEGVEATSVQPPAQSLGMLPNAMLRRRVFRPRKASKGIKLKFWDMGQIWNGAAWVTDPFYVFLNWEWTPEGFFTPVPAIDQSHFDEFNNHLVGGVTAANIEGKFRRIEQGHGKYFSIQVGGYDPLGEYVFQASMFTGDRWKDGELFIEDGEQGASNEVVLGIEPPEEFNGAYPANAWLRSATHQFITVKGGSTIITTAPNSSAPPVESFTFKDGDKVFMAPVNTVPGGFLGRRSLWYNIGGGMRYAFRDLVNDTVLDRMQWTIPTSSTAADGQRMLNRWAGSPNYFVGVDDFIAGAQTMTTIGALAGLFGSLTPEPPYDLDLLAYQPFSFFECLKAIVKRGNVLYYFWGL